MATFAVLVRRPSRRTQLVYKGELEGNVLCGRLSAQFVPFGNRYHLTTGEVVRDDGRPRKGWRCWVEQR